MPLRIILMRIMLWSLAFAAVTGVLAVLFQTGDLPWRVVGTGFATAAACALMMAASRLIDREKSRSAGLLGMAGVIVEFLGALTLIWELPRHLLGVRCEGKIDLTMFYLGMAVLLIMVLLQLEQKRTGAVAARVGIYLTFVVFIVFMVAIWSPTWFYESGEWRETGGVITLFGVLSTVSLIGLGTGARRNWRWAGVVASVVACAMGLTEIWVGISSDPGFVAFCVLLSLAAVVAHANVTMMCPLTPEQRWVRTASIVAAILTAGCINLIVVDDRLFRIGIDEDVLGRLAGAAGIVMGCGTLALCVLARMNRSVDYEPLSPELTKISIVCPRCRKKQSVGVGDSVCSSCKLRISIRIEEPRRPQCGYLLYGLISDRCPECGTGVTARVTELDLPNSTTETV